MRAVHKRPRAEGHGDEGVGGHLLLLDAPDEVEAGAQVAGGAAEDGGLGHQGQVLECEKEQKHSVSRPAGRSKGGTRAKASSPGGSSGASERGRAPGPPPWSPPPHSLPPTPWTWPSPAVPNLSHEALHEEEQGQENEEKEVPCPHDRTAKTSLETVRQAWVRVLWHQKPSWIGDQHADHVHHHPLHGNEAKPPCSCHPM